MTCNGEFDKEIREEYMINTLNQKEKMINSKKKEK